MLEYLGCKGDGHSEGSLGFVVKPRVLMGREF